MSSIQDIHTLEQRIYDIVQNYVDENYGEDAILAIAKRYGKITVTADAKERIKTGKSTENHLLKDLVRADENGKLEADNDKISDIANSWVFLS